MKSCMLDKITIIPNLVGYDTEAPVREGLDFNISVYKEVQFMGHTCYITKTMVTTWFFMLVLFIFALCVRAKLKKYTQVPKGGQNVIEMLVETMDSFTRSNMGDKYAYFGKWFFGVFMFILMSNLSGLLDFRPPTADLAWEPE